MLVHREGVRNFMLVSPEVYKIFKDLFENLGT